MNVKIETIGPDKAIKYLASLHDQQRTWKSCKTAAMATDMVRGAWHLIGDCIQFDMDGNLVNGQHRLKAVIISGTSQKFVVLRGVTRGAISFMDKGQKRTVNQQLKVEGLTAQAGHSDALMLIAQRTIMKMDVPHSVLYDVARKYTAALNLVPAGRAPGYTASIRAVLILAVHEKKITKEQAQMVSRVIRSRCTNGPDEWVVIKWLQARTKGHTIDGNYRKWEWYAAQKVVKLIEEKKVVKNLIVKKEEYYTP
jgi:hypothetical protein